MDLAYGSCDRSYESGERGCKVRDLGRMRCMSVQDAGQVSLLKYVRGMSKKMDQVQLSPPGQDERGKVGRQKIKGRRKNKQGWENSKRKNKKKLRDRRETGWIQTRKEIYQNDQGQRET
jgi:hypothetical protein